MYYKNTTQIPNAVFDIHLKSLSESELKVLLTIIRKTIGIVSPHNPKLRKEKAWVSQKLFCICTGLSARAVSEAIYKLHSKGLILIYNQSGVIMNSKAERRKAYKLYYSCTLF